MLLPCCWSHPKAVFLLPQQIITLFILFLHSTQSITASGKLLECLGSIIYMGKQCRFSSLNNSSPIKSSISLVLSSFFVALLGMFSCFPQILPDWSAQLRMQRFTCTPTGAQSRKTNSSSFTRHPKSGLFYLPLFLAQISAQKVWKSPTQLCRCLGIIFFSIHF